MTASEPPAKWGADSRVDDDVVCRVEEGRATAAHSCGRRRRRGNQVKEEWNSKVVDRREAQVSVNLCFCRLCKCLKIYC